MLSRYPPAHPEQVAARFRVAEGGEVGLRERVEDCLGLPGEVALRCLHRTALRGALPREEARMQMGEVALRWLKACPRSARSSRAVRKRSFADATVSKECAF